MKNDLFGQAVSDYYTKGKAQKLMVRCNVADDDYLPVDYLFRAYDEMPEKERLALKLARGRVLDVGAGAGCHSLHLQEKGFEVHALDTAPGCCEVMVERGLKHIKLGDIREFDLRDFDTVLMLMNGVGVLGTLDDLNTFLDKLKYELKADGQLIMDSSDILYIYEQEDGGLKLNINGAYYGEVIYQMEYGEVQGQPFDWLFVDFHTLNRHCAQRGLFCELLMADEDDSYLCRITHKKRDN